MRFPHAPSAVPRVCFPKCLHTATPPFNRTTRQAPPCVPPSGPRHQNSYTAVAFGELCSDSPTVRRPKRIHTPPRPSPIAHARVVARRLSSKRACLATVRGRGGRQSSRDTSSRSRICGRPSPLWPMRAPHMSMFGGAAAADHPAHPVREGTVDSIPESGWPVRVATSDISQNLQVAATGTLPPSSSSTPMWRWPRYPPAPNNAVLCRQRRRPPENPNGAVTSVEPPLPAARAETSRGTADAPPKPFGSGRHRRRSPVAIPAGAVPDTSFPGSPAGCGR